MVQDQKKAPMTRSEIKREAKFRAGLILESAMAAGWSDEKRYGQEGSDAVAEEIAAIATRLIQSS